MSEHLSDSDTKTEVCLKHLLETHFFFYTKTCFIYSKEV